MKSGGTLVSCFPRYVFFAAQHACSVTAAIQPSLDSSLGHWGWEQRAVQQCLASLEAHVACELCVGHCCTAPSPQHVIQRGVCPSGLEMIPGSLWQETLFTFHNYFKVSLQQTPGTCCHI